MTGAIIREATSLMRKRATNDLTPGPWAVEFACPEGEHHHDWDETFVVGTPVGCVAACQERYTSGPRDAEHIASWHPAVALAVADMLDTWLNSVEALGGVVTDPQMWSRPTPRSMVAVALAYLGRDE